METYEASLIRAKSCVVSAKTAFCARATCPSDVCRLVVQAKGSLRSFRSIDVVESINYSLDLLAQRVMAVLDPGFPDAEDRALLAFAEMEACLSRLIESCHTDARFV